jgi:transcriptional repressor NrdR
MQDKVVDSRESREAEAIRRRRECLNCAHRFTTYEHIEEIDLMVLKKDGRREPFDRHKLLAGLRKACQKRPVTTKQLETVADEIEALAQERPDKEINGKEIGQRVMTRLRELDQVAYVRFASVYREFKDVTQFMEELKDLLEVQGAPNPVEGLQLSLTMKERLSPPKRVRGRPKK